MTIKSMVFDHDGVQSAAPLEQRLNVFALVIYIPGALGGFLDDLRRLLVPHYNPHAHVSVLPPRSLSVSWKTASEQARNLIEPCPPFEVQLGKIRVFDETDVIYIDVDGGARELEQMHYEMNKGPLEFEEPFKYHPHITLAQEIDHACLPELHALAERSWREFSGPRSFRAERAVFVQNTVQNVWLDLAEYSLGSVAAKF